MGYWARLREGRSKKQADYILSAAWRRFREGEASKEDAELIMNDLAREGGVFAWNNEAPSNEQAQYEEGKRSVVWRAFSYFNMSDQDLVLLAEAAVADARAEQLGEMTDDGR